MEVSLVRTSLVNEPGNCGDIIPIVYELTKRTHEKNVRRLGTIIQSIFCAQSGASIHLTVWKWSGESRYPGALPPVLENFRRAFSPGPTDCSWVSEDGVTLARGSPYLPCKRSTRNNSPTWDNFPPSRVTSNFDNLNGVIQFLG